MLSLARPAVDGFNHSLGYSYTAAQVDSTLHASTRRVYFRYQLLDAGNAYLKDLSTVQDGGSIAYDTTQQIKRTASFTILDDGTINYLTDRIKPFVLLLMPDGGYAQFPLGVFLLSTPPRETDDSGVVLRRVTGYDQLQVLVDNKVTTRYVIGTGTNYIAAVSTLLTSAGITQTNLTATTLTLPTSLDWDPGTSYLHIIDKLLEAINYRDLWFDENGIAIAESYLTPALRPSEYTYQDDSQSVMYPQVSDSLDLFAVPNQWVVVVAETDRAVITSTYTNSNASSPTSTVNRGRTIVKYVKNLNTPDSTTLDSIAAKLAFQDSQVYETVVFETAIMPFHSDYDVYTLTFSKLGISDKFSEVAWSFDLTAGAKMSHSIRKVVQV